MARCGDDRSAGRPKTAICRVSEKIQTAHLRNALRALDFFASLHLTIFERPACFDFFNGLLSRCPVLRVRPLPALEHRVIILKVRRMSGRISPLFL